MGFFGKNKRLKPATPVDFNPFADNIDRIYRYNVVSSDYETNGGKDKIGQVLIDEITNKVDGWYKCKLVPTKFQGDPAVMVCLIDGDDNNVHVGWLSAASAQERIDMINDGAEIISAVTYHKPINTYDTEIYFYWNK